MDQKTTKLNNKTINIINQFIQLWNDLKNNTPITKYKYSIKSKILFTLQLLSIEIAITYIIVLIFPLLFSIIKYDDSNHAITKALDDQNYSKWILFVEAVIIGPIIEELVFRLGLVNKRINFQISFILVFFFCIYDSLAKLGNVGISFGISILILSIILIFLHKMKLIERIYSYNICILYFASIIIFGFIHTTNYENATIWVYLISPILVLPQLIGGVTLLFLRVKYGLIYAIASHMMYNGIGLIGELYYPPSTKPNVQYTELDYKNYAIAENIGNFFVILGFTVLIITYINYRTQQQSE